MKFQVLAVLLILGLYCGLSSSEENGTTTDTATEASNSTVMAKDDSMMPKRCLLPQNPGHTCHGRDKNSTEPRWYYDGEEDRCRRFEYKGCGGNENNFCHYHACTFICRGKISFVWSRIVSVESFAINDKAKK